MDSAVQNEDNQNDPTYVDDAIPGCSHFGNQNLSPVRQPDFDTNEIKSDIPIQDLSLENAMEIQSVLDEHHIDEEEDDDDVVMTVTATFPLPFQIPISNLTKREDDAISKNMSFDESVRF